VTPTVPPERMRGLSTFSTLALLLTLSTPGVAQSALQPCPWSLSLESRWGSLDGEMALSPVAGAAVAPDEERVLLVLPQERSVRLHSLDGTPSTVIGQEGQGPGDFQRPVAAGFHGDRIWVWDVALGRLSVFNADGSFASSRTVGPGGRAGKLRDGSLVRVERVPAGIEGPADRAVTRLYGIGVHGPETVDTLHVMRALARELRIRSGQITRTVPQPFSDDPLWGWSPDGRWVAVLERRQPPPSTADGSMTLHTWDFVDPRAGSRTVGVPYEPVILTSERIDPVATALSESTVRAVRSRGLSASASDFSVEAVRESMYKPRWVPPASALLVTSGGKAWIRVFEGDGRRGERWLVVHLESGEICQTELSPEWRLLDVGPGKGVAAAEGPFGVPQIVVFRMETAQRGRSTR
jgi:hypothetical protein